MLLDKNPTGDIGIGIIVQKFTKPVKLLSLIMKTSFMI